jgi:hypothetical protein
LRRLSRAPGACARSFLRRPACIQRICRRIRVPGTTSSGPAPGAGANAKNRQNVIEKNEYDWNGNICMSFGGTPRLK